MPQSTTSAGRVDAAERRSASSSRKHLHAQPVPCIPVRAFLVWRRARAGTAVPVPSRARPLTYGMHYAATASGRLEHARMALQAYECARELKTRAQPDSFAVTGVHVCTCTHRNHAACIRRYFAGANDSAGVRMHNRMHNACAARFRTVVVTLVSRVVSKMCAMANMVLILSYSCHAILRVNELSARAAGATACMRVRV